MSTLTKDGVDVWYDVVGAGEPVVLTGGFAILHEQFHRVTPILAEKCQVVNWNYRGSGLSDRNQVGPLSIDLWAADLKAVLDELKLEKVVLWSASTGALVHVRFAALFPERVKAIVMYPEVRFEAKYRRRFYLYAELLELVGWNGLARMFSLALSDEQRDTAEGVAFANWERDVIERHFTEESFYRTVDVVARADVLPSVSKLREIPILLLLGDSGPLGADEPLVAQRTRDIRALAPHAEMKIIPGTGGTYSMLEKPEETASVVVEYLAEL